MASGEKTESRPDGEQKLAAPSISLPKGGGAIRGMGEKFAANPVTGTGSTTLPIATSPGRAGFGPQLALSYDSGQGNGPFGFGWSLALPAITRRTDKGLPRYVDGDDSDVFVLSGSEDLVPVLRADGSRVDDTTTAPGFTIRRYRPRIEGLFARIERWTRDDGDVHWRSLSRDNLLTVFGRDDHSRISDPADATHIFSWLIAETRDDKGNAVVYEYKKDDGAGVDLRRACERHRGPAAGRDRTANRYIKFIRYGNRVPLLNAAGHRHRHLTTALIDAARWMFEVVFDYGEHDSAAPLPGDAGEWTFRDDPYGSYRSGFEVRTTRRCERVLMYHHFAGEAGVGDDCLVRSTDFTYSSELDAADPDRAVYSFLRQVTQYGYRRSGAGYLKRGLPPVEYHYTKPAVQDAIHHVDGVGLSNLPAGTAGPMWQWSDLHGEGIPGLLAEGAGGWLYKRNIGPISTKPVAFAAIERVVAMPRVTLTDGRAQFMDLAGDGQPDLVVLDGPMPGFYEHDEGEGWLPFRPFVARLNRDSHDPNLRFVDLDGDGRADILITGDDTLVWHPSLGEDGFGPARRVAGALDEESGPRLVFAGGTESVYLADLSGDGLSDLCRIRNGEICYWPNLGYGRFGAKITMDDAPLFDGPDQFDYRRLRLADIDGSGTTDLIYLHQDGVRLYFNQSGNGWSAARTLNAFARIDNAVTIAVTDLLGNGTACLVWSSGLPGDAGQPMRYVDLMGGQKPHLLTRTVNNLGAETRVRYTSSTTFYLRDRYAGTPWITRLPFPVHVVERVETLDHISGNRFVTRYAYHHGYFDGSEEREFRGFGMVEQWDTEEFATFAANRVLPAETNVDPASHVPPVLTRTWFHTGVYVGRDRVSNHFADREYFREPGLTNAQALGLFLPDTIMPAGLTAAEEREACRALKGQMLRQEIYALDGSAKESIPYTVAENNFTITQMQRRWTNTHAVFFTHSRESLSFHYERVADDPRISHSLTLDVDAYGNVRKALAVAYGRRTSPLPEQRDRDVQLQTLITATESDSTTPVDDLARWPDDYRAPLPAEVINRELTGFSPENGAARFSFDEWTRGGFALLTSAADLPYEQDPNRTIRQRRIIERIRTLYRSDDLTNLLALRGLEPLALSGQTYKLALTPGLLAKVFTRRRAGQPDENLLPAPGPILEGKGADQGGYVAMDGGWWVPSERVFYDPAANAANPAATAAAELTRARGHFFLPRQIVDAFDQAIVADHDSHDLLAIRTVDALGNAVTAVNDYQALQPRLITDPNRNRTAVSFDAMSLVVATAFMGKIGQPLGDDLAGFVPDPPLADLQAFSADPRLQAGVLLGRATSRIVYDLTRFERTGQPAFAALLKREQHANDQGGGSPRIHVTLIHGDGFGREMQRKVNAEDGNAPARQALVALGAGDVRAGDLVRTANGGLTTGFASPRWVGSGRTVYDNKGTPVRQYEPFFSATHLFEAEADLTDTGVSSVMIHDAVARVVATIHPDGSWEKVVRDAWQEVAWDGNDTVTASGTLTGDPRSDPDVAGAVRGYFDGHPTWQTWYARRSANQLGAAEQHAAQQTTMHVATPTTTRFDALGRVFMSSAQNRYERRGTVIDEACVTRIGLDIEGNERTLTDARDRLAMVQQFDLLATRLRIGSMDAGERWTLHDVAGKPIRAWDSRATVQRRAYDALRRLTGVYVLENGVERLAERTVYGEGQGDASNHRTRVFAVSDGAGTVTSVSYDFKGNLLESHRDFLPHSAQAANWSVAIAPADVGHRSAATFDAMNRPVTAQSPDGTIQHFTYNDAALLESISANLRGSPELTGLVSGIEYDARGRRTRIAYQNGSVTQYDHDPATFRVRRVTTTRPRRPDMVASQLFLDPAVVQDLLHTYDPVGNVVRIDNAALTTVYHAGQQVAPTSRYTYDARYRLVEAEGREHIGQTSFDFAPVNATYRDAEFVGVRSHPDDFQAFRNYTEYYDYDAAGNLDALRHIAVGHTWTRSCSYLEGNPLAPGTTSNRLSNSTVGNGMTNPEPVTYDAHGNMTSLPHLARMTWDFTDRLTSAALPGGRIAFYSYDADGRRVRKVITTATGTPESERRYVGDWEIYREYGGGNVLVLERETLHVTDERQRIVLADTLTVEKGIPAVAPAPLIRYQLANHLGSACLDLDSQSNLVSYEEYHPYGTTSFQAGRSSAEVSTRRYRYAGKERDEESGFSYHGARYYAPWLCRWTSCDPGGLEDGPNLFAYSQCSPVTFVDPNGKWTWRGVWEETKNAGLAGGGAVWGAGKVVVGGVVGVGKFTYYGTSKIIHETTGSDIWKDQARTWDEGADAVGKVIKAGPKAALTNYVKASGDRFMAAVDKGDMFAAGDAFGTTAMELALIADAAANGPTISGTGSRVPAGAAAVMGRTGGTLVMTMPNGGPMAMAMTMVTENAAKSAEPTEEAAPEKKQGAADKPPEKGKSSGTKTLTPKELHRIEIQEGIEEYLKSGGKIQEIHTKPHLHHLLSQQLRDMFAASGVDIELGKYKVWLDPKTHLEHVHGGAAEGGLWNQTWREFFDAAKASNTVPTVTQIEAKLAEMRKAFGI